MITTCVRTLNLAGARWHVKCKEMKPYCLTHSCARSPVSVRPGRRVPFPLGWAPRGLRELPMSTPWGSSRPASLSLATGALADGAGVSDARSTRYTFTNYPREDRMCLCMYVCVFVCMYACMHACMHACM